ncbi:MAG: peroxiredoxin family protein [Gaiellaceae bacterium]
MVAELLRTGLPPGSEAPDFELPCTDGTLVRLSDLRGQPVLLHFISYTCPVTRGGVSTMRELHRLYGGRVQFVEVLVRQAHPGERHGAYRVYETKLEEARGYQHEEATPWSVLVDDLAGTVQCAYGGLAAAVYLIDSQGNSRLLRCLGPSTCAPARDRRPPRPRRHRRPGRQRHRPPAASCRCDRCRAGRPHPRRSPSTDRSRTRLPRRNAPHDDRQGRPASPCATSTTYDARPKTYARRSCRRSARRQHGGLFPHAPRLHHA